MTVVPHISFTTTPHHLGLYAIVDSLEWIVRLLNIGVTTLQLRIKDFPDAQIENDISTAITLAKRYHARLFINDHWQLAIKHGAYGVHLGQKDLAKANLIAIAQAGLRLGISTCNGTELAYAAAIQPSYIAIGPVFSTQSKQMDALPQGLVQLKRYVAAVPTFPTVAIGGISIHCVPAVLACGVGSVAVISAITKAPDWRQATKKLLQLIEGRQCPSAYMLSHGT